MRRTAGEVLLYQGRPAETVYSSTSNGQTYGNEDVFSSDPLPYLRPVVECRRVEAPTDLHVSTTNSTWSMTIRLVVIV